MTHRMLTVNKTLRDGSYSIPADEFASLTRRIHQADALGVYLTADPNNPSFGQNHHDDIQIGEDGERSWKGEGSQPFRKGKKVFARSRHINDEERSPVFVVPDEESEDVSDDDEQEQDRILALMDEFYVRDQKGRESFFASMKLFRREAVQALCQTLEKGKTYWDGKEDWADYLPTDLYPVIRKKQLEDLFKSESSKSDDRYREVFQKGCQEFNSGIGKMGEELDGRFPGLVLESGRFPELTEVC